MDLVPENSCAHGKPVSTCLPVKGMKGDFECATVNLSGSADTQS